MARFIDAAALAAALCFASTAWAQQPLSDELKAAQALFQQQKWPEAVAAYEAILKTDKSDPRPRAGIAASLYSMREYTRALPYAMEAAKLLEDPQVQFAYPGLPPGAVLLRIARIYNQLDRRDDAFAALEKAVKYPIPNAQALDTDADIAALRADARWTKIAATIRANTDPCGTLPEYRQLDFWVGEWDVMGGAGQRVGTSKVERTLNNCAIFETYTAVPGASAAPKYVGQAFHFYDQNAKTWVQHYFDTTGTPFDWIGESSATGMRYTREGPYGPSNAFIKQRMTFTRLADGSINQLFEQSLDGGKTWRTGFNGTYVKRSGS